MERIDADKASLNDGYWELHKALVSRPGREPESFDTYTVSTYLTRERVGDALGSEIAVSFWQLPDLIEVAEKSRAFCRPLQDAVCPFDVPSDAADGHGYFGRHCVPSVIPSGGIQTMVITGMVGGIGFFLLTEVSRQIGMAGLGVADDGGLGADWPCFVGFVDGVATPGGRLSDASGADTARGVRRSAACSRHGRTAAGCVCARRSLSCRCRSVVTFPAAHAQDPSTSIRRLARQGSFPKTARRHVRADAEDRSRRSRSTCRPTSCIYDTKSNRVIAQGNVEIYYNNYILTADQVIYDQSTNKLMAEGNAQLKDPNGSITRADRFEALDDFRDAFIQSLSVVTPDDTRIAAERATPPRGQHHRIRARQVHALQERSRHAAAVVHQRRAHHPRSAGGDHHLPGCAVRAVRRARAVPALLPARPTPR